MEGDLSAHTCHHRQPNNISTRIWGAIDDDNLSRETWQAILEVAAHACGKAEPEPAPTPADILMRHLGLTGPVQMLAPSERTDVLGTQILTTFLRLDEPEEVKCLPNSRDGEGMKDSVKRPGMKGGAKRGSGRRVRRRLRNGRRLPSFIEVVPDLELAVREALDLHGGKVGDDLAPLPHGLAGDAEQGGNCIDGRRILGIPGLKVLDGGRLKHSEPDETTVTPHMQSKLRESCPGSDSCWVPDGSDDAKPRLHVSRLPLTPMDHLPTLSSRIVDAMRALDINQQELAEACRVSHVAVGKWMDGRSKNLSADNLVAAARALGVEAEWLRTGKLPRERQHGLVERDVDEAVDILLELREPLAALIKVIERLAATRAEPRKASVTARHK